VKSRDERLATETNLAIPHLHDVVGVPIIEQTLKQLPR
jgi:hypothetical protein